MSFDCVLTDGQYLENSHSELMRGVGCETINYRTLILGKLAKMYVRVWAIIIESRLFFIRLTHFRVFHSMDKCKLMRGLS